MKDKQVAAAIAGVLGTTDELSVQAIRNKMGKVNQVFASVYGPVIEEVLGTQDTVAVKARIYHTLQYTNATTALIFDLRKELKELLSVLGTIAKLSLPSS